MSNIKCILKNPIVELKKLNNLSHEDCNRGISLVYLHSIRNYFLHDQQTYLESIRILDSDDNNNLQVLDYDCEILNLEIINFKKCSIDLLVKIDLFFKVREFGNMNKYPLRHFQLNAKTILIFNEPYNHKIVFKDIDYKELKMNISIMS
ncbi:hypothetical protein [Aequorivita sp. CIP111184]|uniref:hypothetical protein n=1 Tax=Aequorivita sp. CIP111184 TaxID=2211356 RepID=UPI000DBC0709|nr:hypothetical protein [Aequorivita sp. CIP111184]SRX55692.1 hypothetical protein AEQU1_02716 [Aequorivita sp. CIP111184]